MLNNFVFYFFNSFEFTVFYFSLYNFGRIFSTFEFSDGHNSLPFHQFLYVWVDLLSAVQDILTLSIVNINSLLINTIEQNVTFKLHSIV